VRTNAVSVRCCIKGCSRPEYTVKQDDRNSNEGTLIKGHLLTHHPHLLTVVDYEATAAKRVSASETSPGGGGGGAGGEKKKTCKKEGSAASGVTQEAVNQLFAPPPDAIASTHHTLSFDGITTAIAEAVIMGVFPLSFVDNEGVASLLYRLMSLLNLRDQRF
jgi:hypothetical protein